MGRMAHKGWKEQEMMRKDSLFGGTENLQSVPSVCQIMWKETDQEYFLESFNQI